MVGRSDDSRHQMFVGQCKATFLRHDTSRVEGFFSPSNLNGERCNKMFLWASNIMQFLLLGQCNVFLFVWQCNVLLCVSNVMYSCVGLCNVFL